jgi:chemotaxis protein MotB
VVDPQPAVQALENDMGNISEVYNEIIADLAEHEKRPVHDDEIEAAINYLPNRRLSPVEVIPGVSATYTPEGIYISLADHLLFKSGESAINPMGYSVLDKIIKSIKTTGYAVRIEGHTDNVPIHTEKYPSNWELSADRAIKVLKYFIRYGNVSPTRLSAVGYADAKPVAENDSDENKARNRRVEIVLYRGGQS